MLIMFCYVMRSAHSLAYHYRNKPQMHSNIAIEVILYLVNCKSRPSLFNEAMAHPFFSFDFFNTQKSVELSRS